MSDAKYYVVTTESIHRIKYLVRGPIDLTLNEAFSFIQDADNPIELKQEWLGEEAVTIDMLTDQQVREIIPREPEND